MWEGGGLEEVGGGGQGEEDGGTGGERSVEQLA